MVSPANLGKALSAGSPHTHMDSYYGPPTIETARVININMERWTLDAVSMFGNKKFEAVQIMMPYFHFENGEGIYAMPEVGSLVWICKPSDGAAARPFVMGFQAPFDTDNNSYRCNRQNLNPGDIMLRTRDENFIILRRGGVVQIGATPITQRIFIPIRNFIKDFCENYELHTLGGELTWIVERTEQDSKGDLQTKLSLNVKEKSNDPKQIATLTIGSHGEDDPTTLLLTVFESGLDGAAMKAKLCITNEGDVSWQIEKTYTITVKSDIAFESKEGKFEVKSAKEVTIEAGTDFNVKATGNIKMEGAAAKLKATGNVDIEGAAVNVGGAGAMPAAKADPVTQALSALARAIDAIVPGAPTVVGVNPMLGNIGIAGILPNIPTQIAKVK